MAVKFYDDGVMEMWADEHGWYVVNHFHRIRTKAFIRFTTALHFAMYLLPSVGHTVWGLYDELKLLEEKIRAAANAFRVENHLQGNEDSDDMGVGKRYQGYGTLASNRDIRVFLGPGFSAVDADRLNFEAMLDEGEEPLSEYVMGDADDYARRLELER